MVVLFRHRGVVLPCETALYPSAHTFIPRILRVFTNVGNRGGTALQRQIKCCENSAKCGCAFVQGPLGTCHYIDPIPELRDVKRMDPHMQRAEHAVLPTTGKLRALIDEERRYTVILQQFQQDCHNDDRHRIDTNMGYHTTAAVHWTARGNRMCQQAQELIAARIAYSKSYYEYAFIQHIFAHCRANMKKLQTDIANAKAAALPEYADILSNRMAFYQRQMAALQMELVQRQGVPANALTGQPQVPSRHAIECAARDVQREHQRVLDAEDAAWANYCRHGTAPPAGWADALAVMEAGLPTEAGACSESPATR